MAAVTTQTLRQSIVTTPPMINIRLRFLTVDQLASLEGVSQADAEQFVADRKTGLRASKVRDFITPAIERQLLDYDRLPLSDAERSAQHYAGMIISCKEGSV